MKLHFVSAECRRWAEDSGHSLPGQADAIVASFGELLRAHPTAVGMTGRDTLEGTGGAALSGLFIYLWFSSTWRPLGWFLVQLSEITPWGLGHSMGSPGLNPGCLSGSLSHFFPFKTLR